MKLTVTSLEVLDMLYDNQGRPIPPLQTERDLELLKLPFSPTQEMLDSGESLYNYRKPDNYIEEMPTQEELTEMLNGKRVTLRQLVYELCPVYFGYFYLKKVRRISSHRISWKPRFSDMKPAGEKKFKAILDSIVELDEQGFLVIDYPYQETANAFHACMVGTYPDRRRYMEFG